jgi:hypothetical protein
MTVRIALIHALAHSPAPINAALARAWPEAVRMNLLDDSLAADLARAGALDERMTQRFITLADYALGTGANAILFTCSAFGPCIDAVKARHAGIPVLKPNEAMVDEAVALAAGAPIGLLATFGPRCRRCRRSSRPRPCCVPRWPRAPWRLWMPATPQPTTAWPWTRPLRLAEQGCRVIALAQFSLARARDAVAAATGLPVLTTPGSAIERLRQRLGAWSAPA